MERLYAAQFMRDTAERLRRIANERESPTSPQLRAIADGLDEEAKALELAFNANPTRSQDST